MMIKAAGLAVLVAAALAPSAASAATTIGSDLTHASSTPGYCVGDGPGAGCTVLQITIGSTDQVVPADGVITRWAVRDAGGDLALRVIGGGPGQRQVVAAGPVVQGTGSGIQAFPAQIVVTAGQRVGVEIGESAYIPFLYRDEQTSGEQYVPPLGAVPTAPTDGAALNATYEIFYNVTIEPDADHDGLGDESQDPDQGGCPTAGALAKGPGSTVVKKSSRVSGCRAGLITPLATVGKRTRLKLYQFNDKYLALVKVSRERSSIQVFDLSAQRRTFSTTRTFVNGPATNWTVTDLVVAPNGDAAWIAKPRGVSDQTTVWVRHGARVQNIDQGRIRPTSLRLADDVGTGIYYLGADGTQRNSSFG